MLYEEYPSRYSADVSRRHRWIRGDWQLAALAAAGRSRPRRATAGRIRSPVLSRWKLFDNLRRSLVPAALTLLVAAGLDASCHRPGSGPSSVIGIILIPSVMASLLDLLQKPGDVLLGQHLAAAVRSAGEHFAQAAFTLACLPYEAFFSLDAIVRTVWRMLVTHKRLLEWNPSERSRIVKAARSLAASCRTMWFAPVLAAAAAIYLALFEAGRAGRGRAHTGPLVCLPGHRLVDQSAARAPAKQELTADQTLFLRKLSRKTWAFFETFVGPEDHWLPPDNYQEHPVAAVAHRTSPTNMGLALLANLSAYDFGYISAGQLIERTANALRTMASTGTPPGPLLQLVRHPVAETAAADLHLDGGQRQSRGPSADLAAGSARASRSPDPGLRDGLTGSATPCGFSWTLREKPRQSSSVNSRRSWSRHPISRPTTLAAARLCLDRLATSAAEVVGQL